MSKRTLLPPSGRAPKEQNPMAIQRTGRGSRDPREILPRFPISYGDPSLTCGFVTCPAAEVTLITCIVRHVRAGGAPRRSGHFSRMTGDRPTGRLHLGHYFGTLHN